MRKSTWHLCCFQLTLRFRKAKLLSFACFPIEKTTPHLLLKFGLICLSLQYNHYCMYPTKPKTYCLARHSFVWLTSSMWEAEAEGSRIQRQSVFSETVFKTERLLQWSWQICCSQAPSPSEGTFISNINLGSVVCQGVTGGWGTLRGFKRLMPFKMCSLCHRDLCWNRPKSLLPEGNHTSFQTREATNSPIQLQHL